MKHLTAIVFSFVFAGSLAAQDITPEVNALLITQRDQLTAVHTAALATAASEFKAKLAVAQAELASAKQDLEELKQRIETVLQSKLAAELQTGDGPRAQIIRDLIKESSKPSAQLRLEAAQTAKAAADKALSDAQAALGN